MVKSWIYRVTVSQILRALAKSCTLHRFKSLNTSLRTPPTLCLCLCLLLGATRATAEGVQAFPPKSTWLFVVGVLEWEDKVGFGSFPQKNRQDALMVDMFREAGVPDRQILYIKDKKAQLAFLREQLKLFLEQIPEEGVLLFYYCGHGYSVGAKDGSSAPAFAPWDASEAGGWIMEDAAETIFRNFSGERAVMLADCCYSGAMVKAVSRLAKDYPDAAPVAAVSSSSAKESSTENWTFTEALVASLQGAAWTDLDDSGTTSLEEFARYAEKDMSAFEGQRASYVVPDDWPGGAALAEVTGPKDGRVGERINAFADDDWWRGRIIDQRGEKFLVRFLGYFKDSDAWLKADEIKPLSHQKTYARGSRVYCEWQNEWWPAEVLREEGGSHLIRYAGYGEEWDEWAPASRLRTRKE